MKNVKALKDRFNNLDITLDNVKLYENLFTLPYSLFKPLLEEILDGRIDIEDTRKMFNKYIPSSEVTVRGVPLYSELVDSNDFIRDNLIQKVFDGNYINDGLLLQDDADLKDTIAAKFSKDTNIPLSDTEKEKIFTGKNLPIVISTQSDRLPLDPNINKELQLKYAALLSLNDFQFL